MFPTFSVSTRLSVLMLLLSAAPFPAMAGGTYTDLGVAFDGSTDAVVGVSADGSVAVGTDGLRTTRYAAYRWSSTTGGLTFLPALPGSKIMAGQGVSANGDVVVGYAIDMQGQYHAFRYSQSTGLVQDLGVLNGSPGTSAFAFASAANFDGTVVVGRADNVAAGNVRTAFRWTKALNKIESLGLLNGGDYSAAYSVSDDGKVVVGKASNGSLNNIIQAYRWTEATGRMESLGSFANEVDSAAVDVSGDGNVIVGNSNLRVNNVTTAHGFIWSTQNPNKVDIGTLGGVDTIIRAISRDGTTVVGESRDPVTRNYYNGFRWTAEKGMQSLLSWFGENGISMGANRYAQRVYDTNQDGTVVVGVTNGGVSFLARVPKPSTDPLKRYSSQRPGGFMLVDNFQDSLMKMPGAGAGLRTGEITLNGAHGKPIRNLLDPGQSALWASGDLGWLTQDNGHGKQAMGEIGYGFGVTDGVTARLSAGGFLQQFSSDSGGRAEASLAYLLPEITVNPFGNLFLTGSGYLAGGKLTSHRGYINGAIDDHSDGKADLSVWGLRVRADLKDAVSFSSTDITPFVSYSMLDSRRDAFSEAGGAFPVRWDAHDERSRVVRAGVDTATSLTPGVVLLGRLEASYGLDTATSAATGQIEDLSDFSTGTTPLHRFGAQAGVGAEIAMGAGSTYVMANVAMGGNNPSAWLAASYRVKF